MTATPTPNLQAAAMRARAADVMNKRSALISREQVADLILALPLEATHAELLAAAAELAEVRALVDAACVIKYRRENRCSGSVNSTAAVDALIEALAPFARKGGV